MSSLLKCESLTKKFRGVVALDRLNLEIAEGSMYGLIGTNGAGKTTLIKIAMNILAPSAGTVEVMGCNSRKLYGPMFEQIGYVSENQELPDWMTVEYFLAYVKEFYPAWDDAAAREMVYQFELPLKRKLRQLSRGMRMKAALASALAYRPRFVVMDEPFSGLDPSVRDELIRALLERAGEATVLISSHDLAEIESFASHIGYLQDGRMQFSEEMNALAGRFREVEVTLASPVERRDQWPASWIHPESSPAVIRFVETRFDRDKTSAEIAQRFPSANNVSYRPMPLREIFVAMAKNKPKAA